MSSDKPPMLPTLVLDSSLLKEGELIFYVEGGKEVEAVFLGVVMDADEGTIAVRQLGELNPTIKNIYQDLVYQKVSTKGKTCDCGAWKVYGENCNIRFHSKWCSLLN